jgi:hypothetical protein
VWFVYTGGHLGCFEGGLSKLHHKCVTCIWKKIKGDT